MNFTLSRICEKLFRAKTANIWKSYNFMWTADEEVNMKAIFAVRSLLQQYWELGLKIIQACTWFAPITFAMPGSALPTELRSQLGADSYLGSKLNRKVRWIWKLLVTSWTAAYLWTTFLSLFWQSDFGSQSETIPASEGNAMCHGPPHELVGTWRDLFTYLLGYFAKSFVSDVSLLPSELIDNSDKCQLDMRLIVWYKKKKEKKLVCNAYTCLARDNVSLTRIYFASEGR